MQTINPTSGEVIHNYEETRQEELKHILDQLPGAQNMWRRREIADRARILREVAGNLKERKDEYARLMADEMGKPLAQGVSEAEKCAWVCEYYADNAALFLDPQLIESDAQRSYVSFQPLGTVLAIMPWNFPFWQLFRFAAPALMAGNAVLLKHAPNVTGCALAIERLMHDSGVPENLFRTLVLSTDRVKPVIEDPRVHAVTLTGSTRAGKAVAGIAGSVLKKTVLELGGSDPYLILEDADIEEAAEKCATSRLINSGQSCIAAKRFVVVDKVYDEFMEAFMSHMKAKRMGSPYEEETDIGPQAREDLRDGLHQQVQKSVNAGAECLMGGEIPEGNGFFYPVTVLANLKPGMPAYDEELFGPVASVLKVGSEEEAVNVANDSNYGLGAAVFSEDHKRAERLAREELQAGCCFVNDFVRSDPRLPFGGIKESGYGRELSHFGIREFVNIKTVYVG